MQAPTRHFSWAELGNPPAEHRERTRHLAHHLERLRTGSSDRPLRILSAYRDPKHNADVGGAVRSMHVQGAAADIPRGYATTAAAAAAGFTGIGSRDGWAVHVDVRTGPVAHWHY
jgi:uncharacterized protein YcbK (DUF882 family)